MSDVCSIQDIREAHERIKSHVHKTPLMESESLKKELKFVDHVFFKLENTQKTGSFKARGAANAVFQIKDEDAKRGVVAHSSGNHGQAVAWACQMKQCQCTVFVPDCVAEVKAEAMATTYGADVVKVPPSERASRCQAFSEERNAVCIPPYNHPHVVAGQGTIGLEILQEQPDIDVVVVPVSGGGMLAGIGLAVKALKPSVKVVAAAPRGKQLGECLRTRRRTLDASDEEIKQPLKTVCDAMITKFVGEVVFDALCKVVDLVIECDDNQIIDALQYTLMRLKTVVEPAGAISLAAARTDEFREFCTENQLKNVCLIVCGGNVDLKDLKKFV